MKRTLPLRLVLLSLALAGCQPGLPSRGGTEELLDSGPRDDASVDAGAATLGLEITAPTTESEWPRGAMRVVTWTSTGDVPEPLVVILRNSDGSERVRTVAQETPDDGMYEWTIPCEVAPGTYRIRVRTQDRAVRHDSEPFTIVEGTSCAACAAHCGNETIDCGEEDTDCGGDCLPCALTVYEDNPRYFAYEGRVRPLLSTGGARVTDAALAEWSSVGINQLRSGVGILTTSSPYQYRPGRTVDDRWGGWDEAYWAGRQRVVASARDRGFAVFFVVFSSPVFICNRSFDCPDRWGANLWNSENGGPLVVPRPTIPAAKTLFYDLADFERPLFGRVGYDASWGWQHKNQYRQEELLAEVVHRFPRSEYPNMGIVLMWELRVGFDRIPNAPEWAAHMIDFVHSLDPDMPVGVGAHEPEHLRATGADFGMANGFTTLDRVPADRPVIFEGYHPRESECWAPGRPEPQCTCFDGSVEPGSCGMLSDEACNVRYSVRAIRDAIRSGYNASMPFPQYWAHQSGRVRPCEGIGEFDYSRDAVKADLYDYLRRVQPVLDGVRDWSDEPGDEIDETSLPPE